MNSRRDFLKFSMAGLSALSLPINLSANESFSDYKALVVIYHGGGNDGINMFIPSSDDALKGYPNYAKVRDTIRVKDTPLDLPLDGNGLLDLSGGNPYGSNSDLMESYTKGFYTHTGLELATNPLMPEIAHLVNQNKIAIVANAGNLIEPATKAEFKAQTKSLPPFLYAHNHQTKLVMNGEAGLLDYTGWAGRLFDNWQNVNGGDIYGMNIAIDRIEHLFYGDETTPLSINSGGPPSYKHLDRGIYDNMVAVSQSSAFKKYYQQLQQHSLLMQDILVNDWNNNAPTWTSTNAYGGELFSYPTDAQLEQSSPTYADSEVLRKLKAVAKLAYIGKNRGLKRQIFFVYDGGYDTHSNQTQQHAKKLRGLSLGLGDFYKALEEMGMQDMVTTFDISDFGRSTGSNGDGTDHAWGGNYFAMGGAVKGGIYGILPDLTLGSDDDITRKGRLIPTTSMSQYYGTILKWFGVDDVTMAKVLPELKNFSTQDLGFMRS
jgi:uncharacterized protein (DUF1501 family)